MLSASSNGSEDVGDTFDEHDNESTDQGLLESLLHTSTDLQDTTSEETSHDRIIRVIFLSVVDQHAVKGGEQTTPEAE